MTATKAAARKRKIIEDSDDDLYDSDEIRVSSPQARRSPLRELPVSQTQNKKRRRILECVMIPAPKTSTWTSSNSSPGLSPDPRHSSPWPRRLSPVTRPSSRPRRAAVRRSYVTQTVFDDSDVDSIDEIDSLVATRRRSRKPVPSEASDFDEDVSNSEPSSEEDAFDDGSSVASVEGTWEEEPETKSKRKPTAPTVAQRQPKVSSGSTAKGAASHKTMKNLTSKSRNEKGLDVNLPPLFEIKDIFNDLTRNALKLGLDDALQRLDSRPLRVATMCSGTESPLLALEMIEQSLKQCSDHQLNVEHLFSVEIVPYKQAYIERNFHPPLIFRDIREFLDADPESPVATTAYGARMPVPIDVDIILAGTSCVDYSNLNKHKKGLEDGGESGDTYLGLLAFCKNHRPAIVILENVVSADWDRMRALYNEIEYDAEGVIIDTKQYYLPQTRQRGYMVCIDRKRAGANSGAAVRWQSVMEELKRRASSPVYSFLTPNDAIGRKQTTHADDTVRDVDWSACEITHMQYRHEKRLGTKRPFTEWQEGGTMSVPENGESSWWLRQVERVKDFYECAVLRKALGENGMYDARYKHRVWNVSQNIHMENDNYAFGITGCLTPSGQYFVSDAGRALLPEETLKLQGIPTSKISLTTETPKEVQDLAGNAMSAPVVGAATLASLICAAKFINPSGRNPRPKNFIGNDALHSLTTVETTSVTDESTRSEVGFTSLMDSARRSLRRCYCEAAGGVSSKPIQQCSDCSHTTCVSCGGNPAHNYHQSPLLNHSRLSPAEFEQRIRSKLPLRLKFGLDLDIKQLVQKSNASAANKGRYIEHARKGVSSIFYFSGIRRTHCWTVCYKSDFASLNLVIDDKKMEWQLFVLPAHDLPSNDWLRETLQQPIGKCTLRDDSGIENCLLSGEWVWNSVIDREDPITIQLEGTMVASWWNQNGMPDFQDHWIRQKLNISIGKDVEDLQEQPISGQYEHLPNCGMACNSLFKRIGNNPGENTVFLFLDPSRVGPPDEDSFIFSTNRAHLEYDEVRPVIARIDPSWRPWSKKPSKSTVVLKTTSRWAKLGGRFHLGEENDNFKFQKPINVEALAASSTCADPISLLNCKTHVSATESGITSTVTPQNPEESFRSQWAFEAMRRQLPTAAWLPLHGAQTTPECEQCAPQKPRVKWKLDSSGSITPYEDPATAAAYERAIKNRPEPLFIQLSSQANGTLDANIRINPSSLAHRALARIPKAATNVAVQWRLHQTSSYSPNFRFRPFKIRPTTDIIPHDAEAGMTVDLFPKQQLALAWMLQQEEGVDFTVEDVEATTIPGLNWGVEARAQGVLNVRGGVCADHPGFGKTITSLALVNSDLRHATSKSVAADLDSRKTGFASCLLTTAATLIICPTTLHRQWRAEIEGKLLYKGSVISVNIASDLSKFSIEAFQRAKIIIVNRSIFSSDTYAERLATFAGMPGPATKSVRPYSEWLSAATSSVAEHLSIWQEDSVGALKKHVKAKYARLMESSEFEAVVPSRRLRGKEYVAEKDKKASASTTSRAAPASINTDTVGTPLFEMFYFNRMIVDEFHEYEPKEYAALKALNADKRWLLSGTPALDDFYDVTQIAGLLGIPLRIGSDARGLMKWRNIKELRKDWTKFEQFNAMLQIPSDATHARIHEIDQQFLDTFVRRNVQDFANIKYSEHIMPVSLDLDHRAIYTELSQHLNSLEMKMRKGKAAYSVDRDQRLHAAVTCSTTAEEALSRAAVFHDRDDNGGEGLSSLIELRKTEVEQTLEQLRPAVERAQSKEPEAFDGWRRTRLDLDTLGDEETLIAIRNIVNTKATSSAKKSSSKEHVEEDDNEIDEENDKNFKKKEGPRSQTTALNKLVNRLLLSSRSLRYLENVDRLARVARSKSQSGPGRLCQSKDCHSSASHERVAVSALCGHIVCKDCVEHQKEQHNLRCHAPGCSSAMHDYHLLWTDKMGNLRKPTETPYGVKIQEAIKLLYKIEQNNDQAILFVQYESQLDEVERALDQAEISNITVRYIRDAGAQIANFRESANKDDKITVIVLNASDETAAGSNLQNANHVIFLSPLLRDSQYGYDSTMAQAIGRVRRHGQKKHIHVYRIVALDTIDVDILEHRERRTDALTEYGADKIEPPAAARQLDMNKEPVPERTQLVKENGKFSLRPQSWLVRCGADDDPEAMAKVKGKSRVAGWEDFSSLVKFSRAYTEDDE